MIELLKLVHNTHDRCVQQVYNRCELRENGSHDIKKKQTKTTFATMSSNKFRIFYYLQEKQPAVSVHDF